MVDYAARTEAEILMEEPYNAADPEKVNNARKKEARERREELQFLAKIMATKEGRKWTYKLIASCNPFGNPIIPSDTHLTYSNLGAQNIGKKLLQDINDAAPDQYVIMIKENR